MKSFLFAAALLFTAQAQALSLLDFRALRDASARGDVMAGRLLESYLNGIAEGVLVVHDNNPLPGVCVSRNQSIKPGTVMLIASLAEKLPEYKELNPAALPFAPVFLRGLREQYPCP